MRGINRVTLVGNLGQDPETRYTQAGQAVSTLSVATTEKWTKDGKPQEETTWHRIVAWGKLAEICHKYLTKGRQVYVEGKIKTRKWQGKDNKDHYTTEIVASHILMLGPKDQGNAAPLEEQIFGGRSSDEEGSF